MATHVAGAAHVYHGAENPRFAGSRIGLASYPVHAQAFISGFEDVKVLGPGPLYPDIRVKPSAFSE